MAESNINAPIPGMSLTAEPQSRPWQKPPQYVELDDVVGHYLERMSERNSIEEVNYLLEKDRLPVNTIVDSLITAGMLEGLHTVAMGTLVAPVIREFIIANAEIAGIEFYKSSAELNKDKILDPFMLRKLEADLEADYAASLERKAMPAPDMEMEEEPMEMPQESVGLIARPQRNVEEGM